MALPVPYLSQFRDIADPQRRRSACSVTCLSMVLAYLSPSDAPSPDELYEEGERIGGRNTSGNWMHEAIVRLSRNHGILAYSQEYRSLRGGVPSAHEEGFIERGIAKLRQELEAGRPVIVSVVRRGGDTPHTAVLIGADSQRFFLHDPDSEITSDGENVALSTEDFRRIWRKFAIFFE